MFRTRDPNAAQNVELSLKSILREGQLDCINRVSRKKLKTTKTRKDLYKLTSYELKQIDVIRVAMSAAFEEESKMEIIGEVSNFVAIGQLHWPDLYARKAVKFAKGIHAFKQLNKSDQLVLLRSSIIEILTTRIAFVIDREKNGYTIVENEPTMQALFVRINDSVKPTFEKTNPNFAQTKNQFLGNLQLEMDNDVILRDLVRLLSLLFQEKQH